MHLDQRGQMPGVAEIERVFAARQRRARRRLDRDCADAFLVAQRLADEREGDAGEVRAAAGAADDDVGIGVGLLHLLDRLEADDRLMHQHVIEHAAERIFGVGVLGRDFHRLRNRNAEAARRIRMRLQDRLAGVGLAARARDAFRAIGLHQRPPVGLLVVGDLDHVDLDFEAEQRPGEGERRAPLPCPRLGRKLFDALFLVVEGLGDRGIGLVAAGGTDALVFVEDAGGRSERLLEPPGAIERRRAPQSIDVANRRRDFDMPLAADLLADKGHRKERREIGRADRLPGSRVEHRRRRRRQVGDDVVPGVRDLALAHEIFRMLAHRSLP